MAFALATIDELHTRFGVPRPNVTVVFTEHAGSQMTGHDRVGGKWSADGEGVDTGPGGGGDG